MTKAPEDKAAKGQTLLRGLEVVEALGRGPLGLSDIAAATGMTYPTTHRLVGVLVERGYVARITGRLYSLGPKMIELGFRAYEQADVRRVAQPFMQALADQTADTVHLARLEGDDVIYLEKLQSRRPVEISSRVGGRKPAISTGIGKAMLLDQGAESLQALYRRNHNLLNVAMTEAAWLSMMGDYRRGGYAFDLGEDEPTIRCVAAPVRDASGRIVAGVSLSSTLDYMEPARMQALIGVVRTCAIDISAAMGFAAYD